MVMGRPGHRPERAAIAATQAGHTAPHQRPSGMIATLSRRHNHRRRLLTSTTLTRYLAWPATPDRPSWHIDPFCVRW